MYILTALIIVAILWFVVKPRIAGKPPDTAEWTGRAGKMVKRLRGRFRFRGDRRELARQFKHWAADAAMPKRAVLSGSLPEAVEGFAAWLGGLSERDLEQFTKKVARFCATVGFDIAWLTDAEVARKPELRQAVEDAVLLYSLGAWRADSVQLDAQVFLEYRAWLANPNRHKAFGQHLHQVLIKRGLVVVPSDLFLASEKERLAQAGAAIRRVADDHPAALHLALRQVAGASEEPLPAAPAPVSAAPAPAPAAP